MANNERGNQCMHDGCNCEVQEGQSYCSSACEKADNETQATSAGRCNCGHPGCDGNH